MATAKRKMYKNPTAAINSGKMKKKSGEIVSPGKIVFKAAAKLAGLKRVTKGGKAGRAIENKMRSEMGLPKGRTTGKTKAINKANYKIDGTPRTQGVAAVYVTKSGKLKEFMSNAPVKGATRRVRDTAQRAEREAKGYTKRQSVGKYPSKKLIRDLKNEANPKTKVPVKRKGK